jgi:hypothetical protein
MVRYHRLCGEIEKYSLPANLPHGKQYRHGKRTAYHKVNSSVIPPKSAVDLPPPPSVNDGLYHSTITMATDFPETEGITEFPLPDDDEEEDEVVEVISPSSNALLDAALSKMEMSDFFEGSDGICVGICGVTWDALNVTQLRKVCSTFGIRRYKTLRKADVADKIVLWRSNKLKINQLQVELHESVRPKKGPQCAFRLMNILFSDAFADDFASIGNASSRASLDVGKGANNQEFWERVQAAFVDVNSTEYSALKFMDDIDGIFSKCHHIKCETIVPHPWKKLRELWKAVNSDFKNAMYRFTLSGSHNSNFYDFCQCKLHTFYLWKLLEERPQLNDMVAAELPSGCAVHTEMSACDIEVHTEMSACDIEVTFSEAVEDSLLKVKTPKSTSKRLKRTDQGDVLYFDAVNSMAVTEEKKLLILEQDTAREEKKMQQETAREEKKLLLLEQSAAREETVQLESRWSFFQEQVKSLKSQLCIAVEDDVNDIKADLEKAVVQKKKIEDSLGW